MTESLGKIVFDGNINLLETHTIYLLYFTIIDKEKLVPVQF